MKTSAKQEVEQQTAEAVKRLEAIILLVFQTVLKTGASIDLQRLEGFLHSVQESVKPLQDELEGRLSRSITLLGNSRDEMRMQLGKRLSQD